MDLRRAVIMGLVEARPTGCASLVHWAGIPGGAAAQETAQPSDAASTGGVIGCQERNVVAVGAVALEGRPPDGRPYDITYLTRSRSAGSTAAGRVVCAGEEDCLWCRVSVSRGPRWRRTVAGPAVPRPRRAREGSARPAGPGPNTPRLYRGCGRPGHRRAPGR